MRAASLCVSPRTVSSILTEITVVTGTFFDRCVGTMDDARLPSLCACGNDVDILKNILEKVRFRKCLLNRRAYLPAKAQR